MPAYEGGGAAVAPAMDTGKVFRVLDPGGDTITTASFVYAAGRLCFRETHGMRGRLTDYFFNDGGREIVLDVGGITLRGSLATFWNGSERLWRLRHAV